MIGYKTCVAFVIGALISTSFLQASDGVKIVSKTKDIKTGATSSTNIYITDNQVLLENKGRSDNSVVMFDVVKEEFKYINHNRKEYYAFDKGELKQLKEQIKMMVMMMQQFASQMSESQKKKLDQMMNPNAGPGMEFREIKGSQKIKKWSTKKYEGYSEDSKATEMYIASYNSIGVKKEEFQAMEKMISYFKENLKEVTALIPSGGSFSQIGLDDSSPVFKEGVPVKTISFKNGEPADENTVESIEKADISDSIFSIPAGYQRKQINMQNQLGR